MRHDVLAFLAATTLGLCLAAPAAAQDQPAGDELASARAQLKDGQPQQAVQTLKPLLEGVESGSAQEKDVRLLLAEAQIAAGAAEDAVETIVPLAEGGDAAVLLATGRAYKAYAETMQSQGRPDDDVGFAYDEARSYLDLAAKKAARGDSAAAIELGNLELYTLGDHPAALARSERLLELDSQDAEARLLHGCALLWTAIDTAQAGDEKEAAKLRATAIDELIAAEKALPKTRPEPWAQLAWLYEADGQPDQAVEAAVNALERTPQGSVATLFHLTLRYANERKYDLAAAALAAMVKHDASAMTAAIRAEQDPTAAALTLSYAVGPMLEANAANEAREALAAIVASRPQNADPWNNYAFVCRETGKPEEAYEGYLQALSFQPESPRLNNDAGVMLQYYLHREYDKAQEYYEKAVELADAALAAKDLDQAARDELESARRDAVGNLKKLAKGDNTWP